ncbi:MAG: FGGY-family carbohydrate kinase, partial [Chloroflexota bacterium]
ADDETRIAKAAAVPPRADSHLFYRFPDGATLPEHRPSARAAFPGVPARRRRRHFVRATLAGGALLYPPLLAILEARGVHAHRLTVIDDESRSPVWIQLKADVTGRTLATTAVPEASALGAAIPAGVACGAFPNATAGARRPAAGDAPRLGGYEARDLAGT